MWSKAKKLARDLLYDMANPREYTWPQARTKAATDQSQSIGAGSENDTDVGKELGLLIR